MEATPQQLKVLPPPLLAWYDENRRVLPWREQVSPYRTWVSEIMLQQTRVTAVLPYFDRFMAALPTVAALADAPEQQLMSLWQGLGYYSRARNLQKAAQVIMTRHGGVFPDTYEGLTALPGVGDYTAGAIASIAFGLPEPAVDGNVLRVVTRITGDPSDISRAETKKVVRQTLAQLIPLNAPGDFNQALMELGALVCLPYGAPECDHCPAAGFCVAYRENKTALLPVKGAKKSRTIENRTVYLLFYNGKVALRRRPGRGLLAGLWEFPNELAETPVSDQWGLSTLSQEFCGTGRHIFTHREWHMTGQLWQLASDQLPPGWVWADKLALRDKYAVPNAFAAFLPVVAQHLSPTPTMELKSGDFL